MVGSTWVLCFVLRSPYIRIVGLCMAAMVAYGILQDQITARFCPEYFTVGHQPIEGLHEPTLLGLAWGFLGSWWGGLFLGLALAGSSQLGSKPPLKLGQLAMPLLVLIVSVGTIAALFGVGTASNANVLQVSIGEPWASQIDPDRHRNMLVVANVHFGAYSSSILGSIVLCLWVARRRRQIETV